MSIFIISQRKNDVGSVENENITFLNFTAFLFLEVHFASFEKRGSYIFFQRNHDLSKIDISSNAALGEIQFWV